MSRSGGGTTATLRYDPLGRLYEVVGSASGTTRFLHDGDALVAEYNAGGTLLRRYVHGPAEGADDPLAWFEGSTVADSARRYLHADERGSIVAVSNGDGYVSTVNSYDEYGIPAVTNMGRFGYTGQAWLPELGLWYYKARMYSPSRGRFMQVDPIGYDDGPNIYAYVGNDPVNGVDPSGMYECDGSKAQCATVEQWRGKIAQIKETRTGSRIAQNVGQRVANALGNPEERNGVKIGFDNSQDTPGVTRGGNISLNMNMIGEEASRNRVSQTTVGMVVLGHEAIHALQRREGEAHQYQGEITAYAHDYWIGRSQGWDQRAGFGNRSFGQYLKLRAFESCRNVIGSDACWRQEDAWQSRQSREN